MGRPAVVPPTGRGWGWMRAPSGALAERGWGAFSESAEGGVDREDSILTGRWAAPVGREGGSGWGTPGRGTRPSG